MLDPTEKMLDSSPDRLLVLIESLKTPFIRLIALASTHRPGRSPITPRGRPDVRRVSGPALRAHVSTLRRTHVCNPIGVLVAATCLSLAALAVVLAL